MNKRPTDPSDFPPPPLPPSSPSSKEKWEGRFPQSHDSKYRGLHRRHPQGRRMFFRFLVSFGFIVFTLTLMLGIVIWVFNHWWGGGGRIGLFVWLIAVSGMIVLPIVTIRTAFRTFRKVAVPLSELVNAANRVAEGDLSVRVSTDHGESRRPDRKGGEFTPLSRAFNHMVSELELADERRRNLTADVAHELRTPLHIIQGNLEGVLDGVYEPSAEHIEATLDETRLLGRLIEDLRILSLAESGQLPLNVEEIDPQELLLDVQTSFAGRAAEQGVDLKVASEPTGLMAADYDRLNQVINNLVSNSLRHTAGGGEIGLRSGPNGAGVKIEVSDTGEGIPTEQLPFIFDRFWRGDKSRSHTGSGGSTGLGLAISQQLVRAMQGTIEVESEVGKGTRFVIVLPTVQ